jgi:hypothetical protein
LDQWKRHLWMFDGIIEQHTSHFLSVQGSTRRASVVKILIKNSLS